MINDSSTGGLKVDDQFELGRGLNRHIGRLFALEDLVDVACGSSKLIEEIWPIGGKTAARRPPPNIGRCTPQATGAEP